MKDTEIIHMRVEEQPIKVDTGESAISCVLRGRGAHLYPNVGSPFLGVEDDRLLPMLQPN